ncbi:MAG TPA: S41 family peptidase, partial [Chitinophagaceae bacterium]|nr:S41 family peptidase [Chitinophagaceae bacterium]
MARSFLLLILGLAGTACVKAQTCDCKTALTYTIGKVEKNYAGFKDKVNEKTRSHYQKFTDSTLRLASTPVYQRQDSCYNLIGRWTGYMKDGHLSISIAANVIGVDSVRRYFSSWPSVKHTEASFTNYLQRKKSLPLEGVWKNEEGNYRVGIIHLNGKYKAFVLKADSVFWMPGQIKFEFSPAGKEHRGTFYLHDHRAEAVALYVNLQDGTIDMGKRGKWYRMDLRGNVISPTYNARPSVVSFQQLSPSTNLITIRSFDERHRRAIDSVVKANDQLIRSTDNLIIDVRGNGGGSDFSYYSLRNYLFTHVYQRYTTELLCTEDNIAKSEALAKDPNFTEQEREGFRQRVEVLRQHLGKFWSARTEPTFPSESMEVLSNPKKIGVIINGACGSTTEQFLIDVARNSSKTTIYGEPSAGVLDYANMW